MGKFNIGKELDLRGITRAELARAFGISKAAVTIWGNTRVPAERVLKVEELTGISRHEIRPDIYPDE